VERLTTIETKLLKSNMKEGDNNWLSTCSTCRKERNKTNRSSTAVGRSTNYRMKPSTAHTPDKGGVPEAQASTFDASESYGQGLKENPLQRRGNQVNGAATRQGAGANE